MTIQHLVDVSIVVAALALVVVGMLSLSTISISRFIGAVSILAALFIAVWIRSSVIGEATKFAPLLVFAWFWCATFYYLGLLCVVERGILDGPPLDALSNSAMRPNNLSKLARVLRWWRHLVIWPALGVVGFVVARGIAGYGWVTTISW